MPSPLLLEAVHWSAMEYSSKRIPPPVDPVSTPAVLELVLAEHCRSWQRSPATMPNDPAEAPVLLLPTHCRRMQPFPAEMPTQIPLFPWLLAAVQASRTPLSLTVIPVAPPDELVL